jgi:antitoxin FitA
VPVNLSIKNVPDEVAVKLRQRAKTNHRSLQGELLALLQDSVEPASKLNARELLQMVRDTGLRTPREATATIRAIRDAR